MSDQNTDRLLLAVKKQDGTISKTIADIPVSDIVDDTPPPDNNPVALINPTNPEGKKGETINLDGSQSKNAASFLWSVTGNISITGPADQPQCNILLPDSIQTGLTAALEVTNSEGKKHSTSVSITMIDDQIPPPDEKRLKPISIVASAQDSGKTADMVDDDNLDSRWSGKGDPQTLTFKFQNVSKITKVELTGYHDDKTYSFELGGKRFETPGGFNLTEFDVSDLNLDPNNLIFTGHGNSGSDYNSYREIHFYGLEGPPPEPCSSNECRDQFTGQCRPIAEGEQANPNTGICELIPQVGDEFSILSIGDDDVNSNAKKTHQQMKKYVIDNQSTRPVKLIVHAGDSSYNEREEQYVAQHKSVWTEQEKDLLWRFSKGNHDTSSSETKTTQWVLENYFTRYLRNTYKEPNDSTYRDNIRRNLWIEAEIIDNVYMLIMDSEDLDVEFKRDQFEYVEAKLAEAKQLRAEGKIDWIICVFHKPFFTLKSSHSPYTSVRFIYKDVFFDAQVDIMIHGHNHNYQAWLPMVPDDSQANGEGKQLFEYMSDGKTFDFSKPHGTIYNINGDGSHEWNRIDDSGSGVDNVQFYKDSGKFGFTAFIINKVLKTMKVQHIDYDGGLVFEYNISRAGDGPPPPDQAKADLVLPSTAEPLQKNVIADASRSIADTVEIKETTNSGIQLKDVVGQQWVKQFDIPDLNNFSIGIQAAARKGNSQSIVQRAIQVIKQGGNVSFDEFGMRMLFAPTGKRIEMEWGSDHRNGQRFNVNHKYINYIMQGYFLLGSGQEKINFKGDGPNHGSCKTITNFECLWYEMDVDIKTGNFIFQYEMPHPDNWNVPNSDLEWVRSVGPLEPKQWIGWACAYWFDPETGLRNMMAFIDKKPFDDIFAKNPTKPLNNWEAGMYAIERGQIVTEPKQIKIPREIPVDFDEGLEAEIRMHRATDGDTNMLNCYVMETDPVKGVLIPMPTLRHL